MLTYSLLLTPGMSVLFALVSQLIFFFHLYYPLLFFLYLLFKVFLFSNFFHVVLVSDIQHHESAIIIHIPPPSLPTIPPLWQVSL